MAKNDIERVTTEIMYLPPLYQGMDAEALRAESRAARQDGDYQLAQTLAEVANRVEDDVRMLSTAASDEMGTDLR